MGIRTNPPVLQSVRKIVRSLRDGTVGIVLEENGERAFVEWADRATMWHEMNDLEVLDMAPTTPFEACGTFIEGEKVLEAVIGRNIKRLREERGLNRRQFGHMIGLHFEVVRTYENASRSISAANMLIICSVLQIDPKELLK